MWSFFSLWIFTCAIAQDLLTDDVLREAHSEADVNHDKEDTRDELVNFVSQYQRAVDLSDTAPEDYMKRADHSGDGTISLQEHLEDTADNDLEREKFKIADANGDNMLDKSEIPALISPETHDKMLDVIVKHDIKDMDKDSSGKIDFEEFKDSDLAQSYNKGNDGEDEEDKEKKKEDTENEGKAGNATTDEETNNDSNEKQAGNVTTGKENAESKQEKKELDELSQADKDEEQEDRENEANAKKLFKRLDTNGDGTLDGAELRPLASGKIELEDIVDNFVERVDHDGDKTVDSTEMVQGKSAISDDALQNYLIAWARVRQVRGLSGHTVV